MSICPFSEELERFVAGDCDAKRASIIREHSQGCTACSQWIEEANAGEKLAQHLRKAVVLRGDSDAGDDKAVEVRVQESTPHIVIEGYDIGRELHRGGQGVVFQAVQLVTKRKVAIKILLEGPFASAAAAKRFQREIELVAQLKHPHIVGIFDSGVTTDGRPFYAMDYIRGLPLNAPVVRSLTAMGLPCSSLGLSRPSPLPVGP